MGALGCFSAACTIAGYPKVRREILLRTSHLVGKKEMIETERVSKKLQIAYGYYGERVGTLRRKRKWSSPCPQVKKDVHKGLVHHFKSRKLSHKKSEFIA